MEKTKSRRPFCHAKATGWRRDLFQEENSHGGLNTLARGVRKLQTASGQVSWLCIVAFRSDDLHSGATARDSHPLPYSSRSTRDTQTHLKELTSIESARYHACLMKSKRTGNWYCPNLVMRSAPRAAAIG
jgi:hypothetical protein